MNMKKMILSLGMGVLFLNGISGCSPGTQYAQYTSRDPFLNVKIEYIQGWRYSEQRGANNSYAQVLFYEREQKGKLRRALMALTARPVSGYDIEPVSALSVLYDILNKRSRFKDFTVLSKGIRSTLMGAESCAAEITYKNLDKLHSAAAKQIAVQERIVVVKKGDTVFVIRYENAVQDFSSFEKAFGHILKTVQVP